MEQIRKRPHHETGESIPRGALGYFVVVALIFLAAIALVVYASLI